MERWQPFRELEELQRTAELMQSVFSGAAMPGTALWAPPVDIEETEDAWILEAELPGVQRDDVNVEVRGSEVAIWGEIKERERTGILRRRTRRVGEFEFRVTLPTDVEPDGIEATLDDGVLTVRIPKAEAAGRRRVDIRSARE